MPTGLTGSGGLRIQACSAGVLAAYLAIRATGAGAWETAQLLEGGFPGSEVTAAILGDQRLLPTARFEAVARFVLHLEGRERAEALDGLDRFEVPRINVALGWIGERREKGWTPGVTALADGENSGRRIAEAFGLSGIWAESLVFPIRGFHSCGSLDLRGKGLCDLPEGLVVPGWIDLTGEKCFNKLPEALYVGDEVRLRGCERWDRRIPPGCYCGGIVADEEHLPGAAPFPFCPVLAG